MTYILRTHRVSFLNRLVPFYFCISFYVTGPSIRTLVSMACLYIVSIKLASAGGGSSFSVSVSPQCCLEVLGPHQPPEQFLVNTRCFTEHESCNPALLLSRK